MILTNEAQSANVFWIVEGAVSIGAGAHMAGNILGGAAIAFGANTSIDGRVMAGSVAGTIALATTVSEVTGTPPTGTPPPIVVANTVTDANGNYLFESVQPGAYFVRWDLSNVTPDFAITAAKIGGDDALDSDSVSGDVGGFVDAMEIEVLGGTTHLNVDLGLIETLPAVKAVALDTLTTTLAIYLEANYYSLENWTALKSARTDGNLAINAATDPAGVATAMDAALAAMAAVPAYFETLMITDISLTPEGEVTLVIRTLPDTPLTLETSTDLVVWTIIASATPDTEVWTFVHDAALANGPRRFYRAFFNP